MWAKFKLMLILSIVLYLTSTTVPNTARFSSKLYTLIYTVYLYIVDFKTTLIYSRHIWGNSIKVKAKQCKKHTELQILS